MKKILFMMLFILSLLCVVKNAHAILINFDDISVGQPTTWASDRYLLTKGVKFNSDSGNLYCWTDPSNGFDIATTEPNYVYGGSASIPWGNIEASFWNADTQAITNQVSFDVIDYPDDSADSWSVSFFDINNALLHSETGTGSGVTVNYSNPNIHRLVFTPSTDFEGFDTLNFNPLKTTSNNDVPEPATMLLFGTGLICFLANRKRVLN